MEGSGSEASRTWPARTGSTGAWPLRGKATNGLETTMPANVFASPLRGRLLRGVTA
jgi:hypothetical protein